MYLIQTVQTNWRPQLPLPKEVRVLEDNTHVSDMEHRERSSGHHKKKDVSSLNGSLNSNMSSGGHAKKWSFGRLFRKKKDCDICSSSEDDCKNGFVAPPATKYLHHQNNQIKKPSSKSKSKSKNNRSKKLIGAGFDHAVINQDDTPPPVKRPPLPQCLGNEFFLPFESATPLDSCYQNYNQKQQPPPQSNAAYYQMERQCLPQKPFSRSSNTVDCSGVGVTKQRAVGKSHSSQHLALGSSGVQNLQRPSSEEELISLNSSTFSKYRSDENILVSDSGQNGQNRRSRAARNERYYKRLSRDSEVSHGQIPVMHASPSAQRWKTQPIPLSVFETTAVAKRTTSHADRSCPPNHFKRNDSASVSQGIRNSNRQQHDTPYVQWGKTEKQPKNLQNSVNNSKRSISYDSHIHLQNTHNRHTQSNRLPPPPPPRDPRRLNISGILSNDSLNELRPISYAFDSNTTPILSAAGRCASDDKVWQSQTPLYQSAQSLNMNLNNVYQNQTASRRRFTTRADRDLQPGKRSMPNGIEMHYGYIADGLPRSRKPIHLLDYNENIIEDFTQTPPSSGIVRTTKSGLPSDVGIRQNNDFEKDFVDGKPHQFLCNEDTHLKNMKEYSARSPLHKPRSASSSRISDLCVNPCPVYSEVRKSNRRGAQSAAEKVDQERAIYPSGLDEVDNIVCGSLHIKPSTDVANNFVEIRRKVDNKSHSMPNHYQRHSGGDIPVRSNKYEEYVVEKREKYENPLYRQRESSIRDISALPLKASSQPAETVYQNHKKPANLEEAIDELEAIYKSLHLGKESTVLCKERAPTPGDFEKFVLTRADSYDDEDSPAGEPDPVRDDAAYRSIKLVNLQHKAPEKQPPFGIPLGPIVPSSHSDYLHVTPDSEKKKVIQVPKKVPDIVKDDLAVRALRKDDPKCKQQIAYPEMSLPKKNRASRTQSANIYALIQRDAAKPSGGDLYSHMDLTKGFERFSSLTNLQNDGPDDIPSTLKLLRELKEQEAIQDMPRKIQVPFRHPKQVGAICQLPEKLTKIGVTTPSKPIPLPRSTITPEPTKASHQLEDALNQIARDAQESSARLSKELSELRKEALITSSRVKAEKENTETKTEQKLLNIESNTEKANDPVLDGRNNGPRVKTRKLHKEGNLIKTIDQVSEAANAVCDKILNDIGNTEPPAITPAPRVLESVSMASEESLVIPTLLKNLSSVKSKQIEEIASRCMRQISELNETAMTAGDIGEGGNVCNEANAERSVSLTKAHANLTSPFAEKSLQGKSAKDPSRQIEEIDEIIRECEAQARTAANGDYGQIRQTDSRQLINDAMVASTRPSSSRRSDSNHHSVPNKAIPPKAIASSFSSSSDCLAKSSSPSANREQSSSITSFHPYSSSDYVKSSNSEYHAPSTDPLNTFSTTSYDAQTASATSNHTTTSTFSYSPSPPLNLTPVDAQTSTSGNGGLESASGCERSSSPLQYNSSEELAMIFGIKEKPKLLQQRRRKSQQKKQQQQQQQQQQQLQLHPLIHAGNNVGLIASMSSQSTNHASSFACNTPEAHKLTNPHDACDVIDFMNVTVTATVATATTTITFTTSNTTLTTTTTTPSPNGSPSSSKLDTISETVPQGDRHHSHTRCDDIDVFALSPNFNKIYASKIRIILDQITDDDDENLPFVNQNNENQKSEIVSSKTQLEEESSSNPDSGNVSLADYPLYGSNTNVCQQRIQTIYSARFEVRNSFLNEVHIPHEKTEISQSKADEFPSSSTDGDVKENWKEEGSENSENETNLDEGENGKEFIIDVNLDRLRNEDLVEISNKCDTQGESTLLSDTNLTTIQPTEDEDLNEIKAKRKNSIVYETPKLEMNISEIRIMNCNVNEISGENNNNDVNFNNNNDNDNDNNGNVDDHVLENESENLSDLPLHCSTNQRRQQQQQMSNASSPLLQLARNDTDPLINEQSSTLCFLNSWQSDQMDKRQSSVLSYDDEQQRQQQQQQRQQPQHHQRENQSMKEIDEKPTSSKALTMLGENRRANSLTVLEQMLVACSLGVITSNDIFTLFLIIIGVVTIVAIILF